jgi:hypothetical protein
LIAGIGAAAADCDVSVWRWYVTNVLRAQQDRLDRPPSLCEGQASAIEPSSRFTHCDGRYIDDGSLAPIGDLARRLRKSDNWFPAFGSGRTIAGAPFADRRQSPFGDSCSFQRRLRGAVTSSFPLS